ncbi:MAG: hypothetical protein U1F83_19790 [Verrucomicrobiota bacterium]
MNYQPGRTYRTTFNGNVTSGGNFGYYDGVATTTTPAQLCRSVPYQRTDYLYRAYFWRSRMQIEKRKVATTRQQTLENH